MSNLSDTYGYIDKCMPADSIFSNLTLVGHFALQYASKASNAGDMSKRNNEHEFSKFLNFKDDCSKFQSFRMSNVKVPFTKILERTFSKNGIPNINETLTGDNSLERPVSCSQG